ncbi:MAG: hypothetical protein K9H49_03345 [Bacteroidales bacterium]|nr:hypothetical protein [Bacteroidales bacterium]MCF8390891.1 hypothetical protein [Bacteroidales bacterium]
MDFDFGNLVYILLTLAFVIFSASKNKKKRVVKAVGQEFEDEPKDSSKNEDYLSEKLKNIFGEYMDIETPVKEIEDEIEENLYGYVTSESQVKENKYEEVLDTNYSILDSIDSEEGLPSTMKYIKDLQTNNMFPVSNSPKQPVSFTEEVMQDFDPRRAILFSEIFRPKYF